MVRFSRFLLPVLALLALAAPAGAATLAPGRVVYPVGAPSPRNGVDPWAVQAAALTPSGGVVTVGMDGAKHLVLTRTYSSGALDPAFGTGGIATLSVPGDPQFVGPLPNQIAVLPDGRLLVATLGPAAAKNETNRLVLTRILASGRRDPSFGSGGSVQTAVQPGAGFALQPDGRTVIAATTGAFGPPRRDGTAATGTRSWAVARINADGSPDGSFGKAGVATLAGVGGWAVAVLADGRIATTGTRDGKGTALLAVLRPDGAIDPGFNGGAPLKLAGMAPGTIVPHARGTIDVLSYDYGVSAAATLQRVRSDGTYDLAFGSGGAAAVPAGDLGTRLLAGNDGRDIVVATPYTKPNLNFFSSVRVAQFDQAGKPDPAWGGSAGTLLQPGFGGGYGSIGATIRLPVIGPLRQNGSSLTSALVRPDGGLVLAGSVSVTQYTGEGEGYMHDEAALAAYRPDLSVDRSFGGAATPASIALSVPVQSARFDATRRARRAIRVTATTSGAGIARVDVFAGRRLIARANAPVFAGGSPQRLLVHLAATGRRVVPHAHRLRVTVRARFRDLVASEATASARGALR